MNIEMVEKRETVSFQDIRMGCYFMSHSDLFYKASICSGNMIDSHKIRSHGFDERAPVIPVRIKHSQVEKL